MQHFWKIQETTINIQLRKNNNKRKINIWKRVDNFKKRGRNNKTKFIRYRQSRNIAQLKLNMFRKHRQIMKLRKSATSQNKNHRKPKNKQQNHKTKQQIRRTLQFRKRIKKQSERLEKK